MNDEIKEIMNKFDNILKHYEMDIKFGQLSIESICHLFPNEVINIKDYITNLQKENENLEKLNNANYLSFIDVNKKRLKAIEFIKEKISSTQGVINDYMYHKEHNKRLIELLQEDIEMYKKELHILNGGDE